MSELRRKLIWPHLPARCAGGCFSPPVGVVNGMALCKQCLERAGYSIVVVAQYPGSSEDSGNDADAQFLHSIGIAP